MLCHGLGLAVITRKWWLCWTNSGRNETILDLVLSKKTLLLHAAEPGISREVSCYREPAPGQGWCPLKDTQPP